VSHLPLNFICVERDNFVLFGGKTLKSHHVLLDGGVGICILGKGVELLRLSSEIAEALTAAAIVFIENDLLYLV